MKPLLFELTGAGLGIAAGLATGALLGVRQNTNVAILIKAGIANIALWAGISGAGLVFVWFATNSAAFDHQLGLFSYQNHITGEAAWTAFFILQAVLMGAFEACTLERALLASPAAIVELAA